MCASRAIDFYAFLATFANKSFLFTWLDIYVISWRGGSSSTYTGRLNYLVLIWKVFAVSIKKLKTPSWSDAQNVTICCRKLKAVLLREQSFFQPFYSLADNKIWMHGSLQTLVEVLVTSAYNIVMQLPLERDLQQMFAMLKERCVMIQVYDIFIYKPDEQNAAFMFWSWN